jgi:hypothetical protein
VPSLLAKVLFKETEMREQRELFETGIRSRRKTLCPSIPPDVRREVVKMLAQMEKKFLQAQAHQADAGNRGKGDRR